MTPLCELGAKWHTDKVTAGYTKFYDLLFNHRRNTVKSVLEIGVGHADCMTHVPGYITGASLHMWEEYFPNAQIYGMDNRRDALINTERIHTQCGSQRSTADLQAVKIWAGDNFDLILDDGDHGPDSQMKALAGLNKYLSPTGIYIIEDVYNPAYLSARLTQRHTTVSCKEGGNLLLVYPYD